MSKNSKKKTGKSANPAKNSTYKSAKSAVATPVKLQDDNVEQIKFESATGVTSAANAAVLPSSAASRLEAILAELETGSFAEAAKEAGEQVDPVGFIRKKMAALGFQAGIQLSGSGAMRDARKILEGFPGDDEYDITFESIDRDDTDEDSEFDDDLDDEDDDLDDDDVDFEAALDEKLFTANLSDEFLLGLDPLRTLTSKLRSQKNKLQEQLQQKPKGKKSSVSLDPTASNLSYPLIDPLKLQVIQSAESELTTVHDLFESTSITPSQKLPMLKRKYMELMQQDIRHRLEALRIRDYLDTLHLERQVVERELEKAIHLKTTLEQICEQLQAENSKIKADKAGLGKIYDELELQALAEDEDNNSGSNTGKKAGKNGKKGKQAGPGKKDASAAPATMPRQFPTTLPEALKPISFELPDANKLMGEAGGDVKALQQRLVMLVECFNQREGHFMSVLKAKDAEIHLLQAHFYQHMTQLHKSQATTRDLNSKLTTLSASEADLRAQLGIYVDKFKQVEDTLAKSNDLFATFRHEMEQMTAKLGRIEKENQMLQTKCSTLSRNIIEMADERSKLIKEMDVMRAQKAKLETLCRTLQAERNSLLKFTEADNGTNASIVNANASTNGKVEQLASS